MLPRPDTGMTRVELVVVLGIILTIIFVFYVPHCGQSTTLRRGQMTQTLSNMKQLHLATQQMALDGETTKNPALGWPGDTGGSFTNWVRHLVPEYLSTNDVRKLLSAPGKIAPANYPPAMNEGALLVYAVSTNSAPDTVFLSTANFTNTPTGGTLDLRAQPYGDKGFVVFRKAGDSASLTPEDAGHTNKVGAYAPLCH